MINQKDFFVWSVTIIGLIAILKLLNKFGLFGKTDNEKGAEEFMNNEAASGGVNYDKSIVNDVAKKLGKMPTNVTKEDIKRFTPSGTTMLQWKNDLKEAKGFFNDNEEGVYNIFRSMKNKVSLYSFSQFFKVYEKVALVDYLDSFMSDGELYKLNQIIDKLPNI